MFVDKNEPCSEFISSSLESVSCRENVRRLGPFIGPYGSLAEEVSVTSGWQPCPATLMSPRRRAVTSTDGDDITGWRQTFRRGVGESLTLDSGFDTAGFR